MYILRRHFGIGVYEAEHQLPAFERDLLLRQYAREVEAQAQDYSQVPEEMSDGDRR